MRITILPILIVIAASAIAIRIQSAVAHQWVPRYDGVAWGISCLVPNPRMTPVACCNHANFTCRSACGLADVNAGWKNECRANCESAASACFARAQPRPPEGVVPGTRPPARTN
jgi:hypothetical protein